VNVPRAGPGRHSQSGGLFEMQVRPWSQQMLPQVGPQTPLPQLPAEGEQHSSAPEGLIWQLVEAHVSTCVSQPPWQ
jgi:hypothetical protein